MSENVRRTVGVLIGSGVGVLAYWQLECNGFHLLAIVGVGLALGVSVMSRERRWAWGPLTSALGLLLSLGVEAWFRPFSADRSLTYFVTHLPDLPRKSLLSLVAVVVAGLYFGVGRSRKTIAKDRGTQT